MDVRLWGPHFWATMDFVAFNYPETASANDKKQAKAFFHSLAPLLPCSTCRDEFAQLLKTYPIDKHLDNRQALTQWLVEVHNRVNDRLQKPRVAYDVVAAKYNTMRGTCEMRQCSAEPKQCDTDASTGGGKGGSRCGWGPLTLTIVVAVAAAALVWSIMNSKQRSRRAL